MPRGIFDDAAEQVSDLNRALNQIDEMLDEMADNPRTIPVNLDVIPRGPVTGLGDDPSRPGTIGGGGSGSGGGIFGNTGRSGGRGTLIGGGGGNGSGLNRPNALADPNALDRHSDSLRDPLSLRGYQPPTPTEAATAAAMGAQVEILQEILRTLRSAGEARSLITSIAVRNEEGI